MMTLPPPPDALPELYLHLVRRVEKLEGNVKQLLAERTHDANAHATVRDVQALKADIQEIRRSITEDA